jgi:two-component system phosphate regulon response regulator OmpR
MKATTTHYKCNPGHSPATVAGHGRQLATSHTLRRAPAASYGAPYRCDDPRLTAPEKSCGDLPALVPVPLHDPENGQRNASVPRVLLIDSDSAIAQTLSNLLMPEAHVTHVLTLAEARRLLSSEIFSLVVMDPSLPDGDAGSLMAVLTATPVLVYSERRPAWRDTAAAYLPKPWTSPRQLWSTISHILGVPASMSAGD